MSKNKTHACLVVDKSGSMHRNRQAVVDSFNEHIQQWKEDNKDENIDIDVSLITFNSNVFEHVWCVKPEELEDATMEGYVPSGGTAARDGIGYAVDKFLTMDDANDEDVAYLFIILSDGDTNSDKIYGEGTKFSPMFKELIEGCRATGRWTFTYMADSEENLQRFQKQSGIEIENMASYSATNNEGTKFAMDNNLRASQKYMNMRKTGVKSCSAFHSEEVGRSACYDQSSEDQNIIKSIDVTKESFNPVDVKSEPVKAQVWNGTGWNPNLQSRSMQQSAFGNSKKVLENGYTRPKHMLNKD